MSISHLNIRFHSWLNKDGTFSSKCYVSHFTNCFLLRSVAVFLESTRNRILSRYI